MTIWNLWEDQNRGWSLLELSVRNIIYYIVCTIYIYYIVGSTQVVMILHSCYHRTHLPIIVVLDLFCLALGILGKVGAIFQMLQNFVILLLKCIESFGNISADNCTRNATAQEMYRPDCDIHANLRLIERNSLKPVVIGRY